MEYGAIIGAVVGLITSFIAMGENEKAQALRQQIADEYGDDILPELDAAIAQEVGPSAFETMTMPTEGRQSQMEIDQELADIYDTAGQTEADRAAYDVARREVSRTAASNAADAQMVAGRRGMGGGAAAALASQGGQDELEALAGLDARIASDARGRGLAALNARAGNAAGMRGGDWNELSGRAGAIDLNNRFNASQRQQTGLVNAGLPQQDFNNRLAMLAGRSGALNGVAGGLDAGADRTRQTGAGLANSAVSFGQAWDWGQDEHDDDSRKDH